MSAHSSEVSPTPDGGPLTSGAPEPWRRRSAVLLAAGTAVTVAAVLLDRGQGPTAGSPTALLAALGMMAAGVSDFLLALERRRRELSRRATPLLLLAISVGLIYLSLALGYLWGFTGPHPFTDALELPAAVLGLPLWIVATLALTWPPRMTRRDVVLVVIDGENHVPAVLHWCSPCSAAGSETSRSVACPLSWANLNSMAARRNSTALARFERASAESPSPNSLNA